MNDNRLDLDSVTNIGSSEVKVEKANKKVKCLGKTFASDDERREYFREELRKKLPELKKIEGFPIGEDDDIVNLSDPPYYTACPNPWLNDFVAEWEEEKKALEANGKRKADFEVRTPYASDVSEGRSNPVYLAHSYHTKVPHPAIMRFLMHYTQPGDIVLDGFCGTGMTGVAASACANPSTEEKLKIEENFKSLKLSKPIWGKRHAICSDLSPLASFIAYTYNTPIRSQIFRTEANKIIDDVERECGWLYETKHTDGSKGTISHVIWSNVYICPNCGNELVFFDVSVDFDHKKMIDEFVCPSCGVKHNKDSLDTAWTTCYDNVTHETYKQAKSVPVIIRYTDKNGRRFEKVPDDDDINLIARIESLDIPYEFPKDRMIEGREARRNDRVGITHVHQFFTKRNLWIAAALMAKIGDRNIYKILLTSYLTYRGSKLTRYKLDKAGNANLPGTLYIAALTAEQNLLAGFRGKIDDFVKAFSINNNNIISICSLTKTPLKDNSIDYIFTDPPFGANLMYSELNFIQEAWLKLKTNNHDEAIENESQNKSLHDYQCLMQKCFAEYYRVLKPGKWITIEFSNTSASVWNAIQLSLNRVGFVSANVAALDKQQGSFMALTTPTAVKQDLVISCYKPSETFLQKFTIQDNQANTWSFIEEQLAHLPMPSYRDGVEFASIIERSPKVLYDRLITFFLMRGLPVPVDAADFQEGLRKRFIEEDGMMFTREQLNEYAALKQKHKLQPSQISMGLDLIVTESDAIAWLNHQLKKPQKYQDLQPDFRKANMASRKGENPIELMTVLEENFIKQDNDTWRIPDLNEAKDREILRNKSLLKIWDGYCKDLDEGKVKKIKEVRLEAVKAGFKKCFQEKDFVRIKTMGDSIPENILTEDETLLNYYDIACTRI